MPVYQEMSFDDLARIVAIKDERDDAGIFHIHMRHMVPIDHAFIDAKCNVLSVNLDCFPAICHDLSGGVNIKDVFLAHVPESFWATMLTFRTAFRSRISPFGHGSLVVLKCEEGIDVKIRKQTGERTIVTFRSTTFAHLCHQESYGSPLYGIRAILRTVLTASSASAILLTGVARHAIMTAVAVAVVALATLTATVFRTAMLAATVFRSTMLTPAVFRPTAFTAAAVFRAAVVRPTMFAAAVVRPTAATEFAGGNTIFQLIHLELLRSHLTVLL